MQVLPPTVWEENVMRYGTYLLVVAGIFMLFTDAQAFNNHNTQYPERVQGIFQTIHQDDAVIEHIQWIPGNACACPAVRCSFMNETSPPCQVSCASGESAVCQCATCRGAGGIVSLVGVNSCRCVASPSSGSRERRSR